jgi:erythromycin esterase-like protein
MMLLRRMILALSLVFSASFLSPSAASAQIAAAAGSRISEEAGERAALDAATRDLCGRDVALLGENGFHGDGRTTAFKVALIQRLVRRCHFNAVFFEASHYDFLEISRRLRSGEPVSAEMISSAIGWLWNHEAEMAPLLPFLLAEARSGRVALGGLDDQLGGRGMFYSLDLMPVELSGYLAGVRRDECRELFRRRIWSDFPADAPYSEAGRARIGQCLGEVGTAVARAEAARPARRDHILQLIANFERAIARDSDESNRIVWERDHSMYLNLRWLAARLPRRSRIIVWAANGHVAKDAGASPLFAGGRNLGAYVHQAYGRRAFALGFSAASGSFRYGVRTSRPIAAAPPNSLEARAIAGTDRDAVYLGPARLAQLGPISGAAFDDHQQIPARWASVYDGIVVFRAERPPQRTDE